MATLDCGHETSPHGTLDTGYGQDSNGRTFCYECAATMDRESMIATGKATLYLVKVEHNPNSQGVDRTGYAVTNWPGSLKFYTGTIRKGKHNIAGHRYDAWFTGPDGKPWHAVQYGENTQIAHCKRVARA